MPVDEQRLNAFLAKTVADVGAAMSAVLVSIGDELGLYKALAAEPLTAMELATKTRTHERYVREWLANQAAGGYVQYDPTTEKFSLSAEQAFCLADPNGPVDVPGAFSILRDMYHIRERALENFRSGKGMEWGEHHHSLFEGTERFFRATYKTNLLSSWLPALDGVVEKLMHRATVADVGCGHGASTILMAQAFPHSMFVGFDYHESSIETARQRARAAGVSNVRFEVADATAYEGPRYDLIAFFDCVHDMPDPAGVARHARESLHADGHVMVVEPFANDRLEDNLNPVGRVYYAGSTMVCVPVSLARDGPALGAQAGERRLREVFVNQGGFTRFRRATETPFNMVFEARP
jgi:2-polyprenyl-3-methyl-5-hydroxy-6-metoxy-1,4-benzoquinol methylase